jgi:hypothetical protein
MQTFSLPQQMAKPLNLEFLMEMDRKKISKSLILEMEKKFLTFAANSFK